MTDNLNCSLCAGKIFESEKFDSVLTVSTKHYYHFRCAYAVIKNHIELTEFLVHD